jgi:hypothetical protein
MLSENYLDVSAVQTFEKEPKWHLPLSVIAMRAAALSEWLKFGQFSALFAVYRCIRLQKGKRKERRAFYPGGGILKGNAMATLSSATPVHFCNLFEIPAFTVGSIL